MDKFIIRHAVYNDYVQRQETKLTIHYGLVNSPKEASHFTQVEVENILHTLNKANWRVISVVLEKPAGL